MIRAVGIEKSFKNKYHETKVLKGIDVTFDQGKLTAIMGSSGSGKSTLLYILGGLLKPDSGEVYINDKKITSLKDDDISDIRCNNIGVVFQFYNLVPTMTVEENIQLPLILAKKNLKMYNSKINELIDIVGLTGRNNDRPMQLSGGEQQRVAIARALINDPDVILADEPTGNLDSKNSHVIEELLRQLCDRYGKTIVMVTHDPATTKICDKTINMKDGLIHKDIAVNKL